MSLGSTMESGGKKTLNLVVLFFTAIITIAVLGYVGLYVGGTLENSTASTNFSTEIDTGFTDNTNSLIGNISAGNDAVLFFGGLLIVIAVLLIFGGLLAWNKKGGSRKSKKGDMGF